MWLTLTMVWFACRDEEAIYSESEILMQDDVAASQREECIVSLPLLCVVMGVHAA